MLYLYTSSHGGGGTWIFVSWGEIPVIPVEEKLCIHIETSVSIYIYILYIYIYVHIHIHIYIYIYIYRDIYPVKMTAPLPDVLASLVLCETCEFLSHIL